MKRKITEQIYRMTNTTFEQEIKFREKYKPTFKGGAQ